MKALFLAADDGISGPMWRAHAAAYLQRGRPVLAVTEADNVYDAVGTGDDLPDYGLELTAHADFTNRKVALGDAAALAQEIRGLPGSAAVLWNMSVFNAALQDERWMEVFHACVAARCDVLFMHYWGSAWHHGTPEPADALIRQVPWDYAAGSRLVGALNGAHVRSLLPGLAKGLDRLKLVDGAAHHAHWQVVSPRCSLHQVGPHWELPQRQELLSCLPCCRGLLALWAERFFK